MANETVLLKIQADNKQALASIDKINKKLGQTEEQGEKNNSVFSKMGSILGGIAVAGGLATIGRSVIKTASDLEEAENKLNAVFGGKGQALVNDFATRYQQDIGASILQTKNFIADAGNLFNGFGMGEEQARGFSTEVLKLTNDLASFNNLSTEDAQRKMMSALMGESESAKGLGASILEDQMKRASLALGLGEYSNKMDELTKIQIRYKAILMQSQKAIGDALRSTKSYNGQMKYLQSTFEKVSLSIGEKFLPAVTSVIHAIVDLTEFLYNNSEAVLAVVSGVTAGAVAYGIYAVATSGAITAIRGLTVAQIALSLAFLANPIGLVVTAIATLTAGFVYLWNANENFRVGFFTAWYKIERFIIKVNNRIIDFINDIKRANKYLYDLIPTNRTPLKIDIIAKYDVLTDKEIESLVKSKALAEKAVGVQMAGQGGSTTTNGNGLPFQAGSPANNVSGAEGDSFYKTFNSVGDSTTVNGKSGEVRTGDITINITQKADENTDELLDRLTYKIANEFNRAGKIAGIL